MVTFFIGFALGLAGQYLIYRLTGWSAGGMVTDLLKLKR